jgi:hypothetical protein
MVVANLLNSHKDLVILHLKNGDPVVIERTLEDRQKEVDIEDRLVNEVVKQHDMFLAKL